MSEATSREITVRVALDEESVPEAMEWQATDSPNPEAQPCESCLIALWDATERSTLRIDLWTKKMQVPDMNAFMFQTLGTLAETFRRATGNHEAADEIARFTEGWGKRLTMPRE